MSTFFASRPEIAANASSDLAAVAAGIAIVALVGWLAIQVFKIFRAMKGGAK
jgi:hypothetical protein